MLYSLVDAESFDSSRQYKDAIAIMVICWDTCVFMNQIQKMFLYENSCVIAKIACS